MRISQALCAGVVVGAVLLAAWTPSFAQSAAKGKNKSAAAPAVARANDSYDQLLARYLEAARAQPTGRAASFDWMASLGVDPRARKVNDLVTVRIFESITGSGSADSSVTKAGSATAGVPNLFGLEKKLPGVIDPSKLVNGSSSTAFKGAGATTRAGELTAIMTVRVAEVLTNGDLVLEGIREIEINGDRQVVVLTGVARPTDIDRSNTILSVAIGQLRIRYFGNGLIKDNLKPGFLVRILNKIF
jgi:flagellar L-ring protein precursor FlgH